MGGPFRNGSFIYLLFLMKAELDMKTHQNERIRLSTVERVFSSRLYFWRNIAPIDNSFPSYL